MKSDKIVEALGELLPADVKDKVTQIISEMAEKTNKSLEEQYNAKLAEAYEQFEEEKKKAEEIAHQGYCEAQDIILSLRDKIETLKNEYDKFVNENNELAFKYLQEEKSKNQTLETDLYEEYDNRLGEVKSYIVDKVDQFLALKGEEFFEAAKRDVMNDPTVAEHKVALDKILEVASTYLDVEDYSFATSSKIDDLTRQIEEAKGQMKILEAKNMRLSTENTKLNEVARHAQEVLTEGARIERTARKNTAKNAESKGQRVLNDVKVIAEHNEVAGEPNVEVDPATQSRNNLINEWKHLAGLTKKN